MDPNPVIQRLLEANPLRDPVLRNAIQALNLPPASRGLDLGCGIGLQALLLAEAVGSEGHISAVDLIPDLLAFGEKRAAQAGLLERITFCQADASRLPFAENSFDWVWSADFLGYPVGELSASLKDLVQLVKPGGSINILAWTSQQVLPGHPLLEARLNATCSSYLPYLKGVDPELHFQRAMRWFREAGLEVVAAQTLVGDVQDPLNPGERAALASLFEMLWTEPGPEASPEDWLEVQRLCMPGSADFIVDRPGYYAFFTCTLFRGRVPPG
jgi:demethylmenaquinone methyltransferase/2-methoxy-6-polyprenyl-1,4-benzoquinol methylase